MVQDGDILKYRITYFKVRGFVKGSNNCVRLEILLPVSSRKSNSENLEDGRQDSHHPSPSNESLCAMFGQRRIENFRETGVCITVDLNCLCGITCLDPITPQKA